jgi:hypothetical protein
MNNKWLSWIWITLGTLSDRRSAEVIAYLQEENKVLRELSGDNRLVLNDHQRRRLATKGNTLGPFTLEINCLHRHT